MRSAAFARCWERSSQFRRTLRIASFGWGLACLVDAALRVVVVYRFPLDRAAWLSNLPHLTAIALLMGFSALMGRITHRLVENELTQMRAEQTDVLSAAGIVRESRA